MNMIGANWPAMVLAIALALVIAYLVADVVGRAVHSVLRAVIADPHVEALLVERPRRVVRLVVFLATAAALSLPALRLAGYKTTVGGSPEALARWALDGGIRIVVISIAAYLVIRIGTAATGRFEREMSRGTGLDVLERTKRAQTLGRLLQKSLTIVVSSIAALMIMRELQVDITPVLTGAGVLGLAVGFGAQTLVRDVISGFLLIMEDQVRVGDVAVVNGQGGLVESVNLRTIVLRDDQGTVHVFPNGEVKTLANMSKDFSFYVISVGIGYDEDPDRVMAAMQDAAATLMTDTTYQPHILAPLEVQGVDSFEAGQMVIKARIKTVPLKQWLVGRELRKRLAHTFRERAIHSPVGTMNVNLNGLEAILAERSADPDAPTTRTSERLERSERPERPERSSS
jgi:small conductance mechanosensitive channel